MWTPAATEMAATVPCPVASVTRPLRPAPPAPPWPLPTRRSDLPVVGGDALATEGLAVPAGTPPLPGDISATSWLVADLGTGAVLGACGAHEYAAPASVQKLLLVATLLPKLPPDTMVTITAEDLNFEPGSSAVGLLLGGTYSVQTLWLGLLLNSGNDAANVLARLGGGDRGVPGTLADMNAEARRLGALDTHAETPSGLDGPGQVTSAYDLALIARACFAREDFRAYAATRGAQIPPQPPADPHGYQIQNDNRLLTAYPGALGGKTGFTDAARHTFVGAAERDGRRLVVTMLGAEHQPVRTWEQASALLDWGFTVGSSASVGHLVDPGEAAALTDVRATRREHAADVPGTAPAASVPDRPVRPPPAWQTAVDALRRREPAVTYIGVGVLVTSVVVLVTTMRVARRRRGATRRHRGVTGGGDV